MSWQRTNISEAAARGRDIGGGRMRRIGKRAGGEGARFDVMIMVMIYEGYTAGPLMMFG